MKLVSKLSLCAAVACFSLAAASSSQAQSKAAAKPTVGEFKNAEGQSVGTATLSENPKGVKIKLDIKGLPAGQHSIHIHQNAKCDAPDFKTAGPHFSPMAGMAHDHNGAPAGDIPDFMLIVAGDGSAHVSVDDKERSHGRTGDDLIDPVRSLEGLLRHAQQRGITLHRGDIVSTGSLSQPFDTPAQDSEIVARFLQSALRVRIHPS